MMCVVAIMTAENERTCMLRVPKLAMRPLAAGNDHKPPSFEVGDKLANLAWHT